MNDALKDKVGADCIANGGDGSRDEILETLSEAAYDAVKEYGHDEHRWYTLYHAVVKVGDFFVDIETFSNSGDEPAMDHEDANKMIWDSAVEVFPKEVTVTDYVTADKL
jgi:hypothetical protein